MRSLMVMVLLWGLGSCGGIKPPKPPEPPTCPSTCPHGTACTDPEKGCEFIQAPGPVCGENEFCDCWHMPPDSPVWLEATCPTGQQCVNKKCETKPTEPPPVDPPPTGTGCNIDGEPGLGLANYINKHGNAVNLAIKTLLPNCEIGARCVVTDRPQVFQSKVEAQLRKQGLCSGQHAPDTDEIAVSDSVKNPREGFHIYAGAGWDDPNATGTVVWAPQAARGAYAAPALPPTQDYGCPPPQPERVWTVDTLPPGWGQNEIGQPRWKLNSSVHGAWIDTTAVTVRNVEYGEAIGMSPDANGVPRAGVPMRPEGPTRVEECATYIPGPYSLTLDQCKSARQGKNRVECERYIAEGDWITDSDDGQPCEQNPENSAQFRARGGHCRLCNPAKTVCTDRY